MITEAAINREAKVHDGSAMDGYNTSDQTNDEFIKTNHVMAKVRSKLKEQVNMLSSCVHKVLSPGSRKYNDNIRPYHTGGLFNLSRLFRKTSV